MAIIAAIDRFDTRVQAVAQDRWDNPTPCSEWSVRRLVNHLVSEHFWAPHILAHESLAQVGDRYEGDLVGTDPAGVWKQAAQVSREAWLSTDLSGTVELSFGTVPADIYAGQMFVDLTVHEWDLARGSGQDETLDPQAVGICLGFARQHLAAFEGTGIFAPSIPTTSTDPTVQLMSLLGRAV
nr:TIGR03086 family metal-binding protein [Kineosporia rhizophila]